MFKAGCTPGERPPGRLESNPACPCWPSWCPWPWRASPNFLIQPTRSGPCLCPHTHLLSGPSPWPSHWGYVEVLSILRTVSSPVPSGPLDAGSGTPFSQPVYYSDSHHLSSFCINIAFSVFLAHQSQWHRTNTGEKTRRSEMWWRLKGSAWLLRAHGCQWGRDREFEIYMCTLLDCK